MANASNAIIPTVGACFFGGGAYGVRTRANLANKIVNSIKTGVFGSQKLAGVKNLVPKLYQNAVFRMAKNWLVPGNCTQKRA